MNSAEDKENKKVNSSKVEGNIHRISNVIPWEPYSRPSYDIS